MDKFESDLTTLHPILTECRVIKSDLELSLIQFANDISSEAHVEVIICENFFMVTTVLKLFSAWTFGELSQFNSWSSLCFF